MFQLRNTIFRLNYSPEMASFYYQRYDYEGAARYINENIAVGDEVVSFLGVVDFYLNVPLAYRYIDRKSMEYKNLAACDDTKDIWSNAFIVSALDELDSMISSGAAVWVISQDSSYLTRDAAEFNSRYAENLQFVSIDGTIQVYKF